MVQAGSLTYAVPQTAPKGHSKARFVMGLFFVLMAKAFGRKQRRHAVISQTWSRHIGKSRMYGAMGIL